MSILACRLVTQLISIEKFPRYFQSRQKYSCTVLSAVVKSFRFLPYLCKDCKAPHTIIQCIQVHQFTFFLAINSCNIFLSLAVPFTVLFAREPPKRSHFCEETIFVKFGMEQRSTSGVFECQLWGLRSDWFIEYLTMILERKD